MNDTSTTEGTGQPPVMARTEPHVPPTKQEYYDLLVKSATDGTFPADERDWNWPCCCRYRTSDGRRCAAGLLIPDAEYRHGMEGKRLSCWPKHGYTFKESWVPSGMLVEDVVKVQEIHDDLALAWDAQYFVAELNRLECFQDCTHTDPSTLETAHV